MDTPAEQVHNINRAFADTIAAKDAEIRRLGEELEDYKESLAMEVGENVRIFEAMGLTTNESFGHDTATGAIIRVYNAMKERANAAESKLAALESRVGEMEEEIAVRDQRIEQIESTKAHYRQELSAMEDQNSALKASLEAYKGRVEGYQQAIAGAGEKNDTARREAGEAT